MGYRQDRICRRKHDTLYCGRNKAGQCKSCTKEYDTKYRNKKSRLALAIARRNSDLKHCYGITLENYNSMLDQQKGSCAGCGTYKSFLNRGLFVDHNHITGTVRGLLCGSCNYAIGLVKENTETLITLANYLKRRKP